MSGAVTPDRMEGGAEDCTDCTLALDSGLEVPASGSNRGVALRTICGAWAAGALAYGATCAADGVVGWALGKYISG